ncbi:hypothetical protein OHB04_02305 [Streptomyces sp. NBC_01775]|uniref:hypothetical protein n=1 Tax=Streptomyces sp. NBC_01775 TaxID=2975939 RepID=UPI002DDB4C52|nr:hypothetical protein [Streptomyces sp. NBC_01775]WSB74725.1 hypothetical protein OHB04_02305 [Streptomyces sp. NBC_01775]
MATTAKTAGTEVVELDSLAKQRRDALPEPTTFALAGVEFTLPAMKTLPMDLQERVGSLEDGLGILKLTLGPEKVAEMVGAGYTLGDLELIAEEWQKRSGMEPGESTASLSS